MALCGWASIDERGRVSGGVAGDQTGREVKVGEWYNFGQSVGLRFKNRELANRAASVMKAICLNDHVGYDQGGRTSLYRELKAVGWDVSKLKTDCECDCSSLIAVVLNAVGISLSKDIYTGNACCIVRCGFCQVPRSPVRSFLPGLGRSAGICPLVSAAVF